MFQQLPFTLLFPFTLLRLCLPVLGPCIRIVMEYVSFLNVKHSLWCMYI